MTAGTAQLPPQPTFGVDQRLSVLVHAGAKVGKSTFSATAPGPMLVLDAEGSWRFIPLRKFYWDPMSGPPPQDDSTWDVCVVTVRTWEVVQRTYVWLTQYITPFVSVIIDSITEIQRRCRENLVGTDAMKMQDWGVLLARMDNVIRGFRDLTLYPQLNIRCVVFVAETRMIDGKYKPSMQGQIGVSLPYWVDICGYLMPFQLPDGNGQSTVEARQLIIVPNPMYEAGERVQGKLPPAILVPRPDPQRVGTTITEMMTALYS